MLRQNKTDYKRIFFLSIVFLFISPGIFAHTINYTLERVPTQDVFWYYFKLGFRHIIPEGPDHILFVISLCLLSTKVKTIFWHATAFTVSHTLTLSLSKK